MTRAEEVRVWRRIGRGFEWRDAWQDFDIQPRGRFPCLTQHGLCFAMNECGLPAYGCPGDRINGEPHINAGHRALTAYLLAEMVADGCAPGDEEAV